MAFDIAAMVRRDAQILLVGSLSIMLRRLNAYALNTQKADEFYRINAPIADTSGGPQVQGSCVVDTRLAMVVTLS